VTQTFRSKATVASKKAPEAETKKFRVYFRGLSKKSTKESKK